MRVLRFLCEHSDGRRLLVCSVQRLFVIIRKPLLIIGKFGEFTLKLLIFTLFI